MGQKVNPHGLRVGVIKDWDSRWYAKDEVFGDTLVSDYKLRKYLKERLKAAGVPKIEIERTQNKIRVIIHCAKPGHIIGKGGTEIEKLRTDIEQFLKSDLQVSVNVNEVKNPDVDAQLVAENIASQLEKRGSFRRAMKLCIGRTMRLGAKGIKVAVSGRLAGAEIARTEQYHDGTIPLQTIRADIDYGFAEANTTYGKIGVKVWIYKGEVLQNSRRADAPKDGRREDRPRRDRNNRGERREGFNRGERREGGRDFRKNDQRGAGRFNKEGRPASDKPNSSKKEDNN
ncbi:MAG: 30S ribosomal protein S3 [Ruminococcaceae bacterium]|nr:30S ribosomal protein S3 [Oscillospiraceae bacterium]